MFINDVDMATDVTGSFLFKFADDTKVGMVVETEEQRYESLPYDKTLTPEKLLQQSGTTTANPFHIWECSASGKGAKLFTV